MRHRKSFNHLGRKTAHRSAMLANMASSLILHKRIETTTAKAKALRGYVEPLITKSKEDTTHSRRTVFSYLQNKEAVTELFREVSVKVADRPGGYLRLLKIGSRLGDNAEMCIVELVDYNENLLGDTSGEKAKTGRRRRGAKKKAEQPLAAEVKAAPVTPPAESVISDAEIVAEEEVSAAAEENIVEEEVSAAAEENIVEEEVSAAAEENIVEEEKESSSESTNDVDGEKK